jgi:hypothetical protein
MWRVLVIAFAGFALSGCASFSVSSLDFFNSPPPVSTLQLESMPPGAEARASTGEACRTPCAISVPVAPLTITYTLDRYQPQTVSVQPVEKQVTSSNLEMGVTTRLEFDPNPAYAELMLAAPPKRVRRPPPKRQPKRAPPVASQPAPAPAPAPAASPFPPPTLNTPFPSR